MRVDLEGQPIADQFYKWMASCELIWPWRKLLVEGLCVAEFVLNSQLRVDLALAQAAWSFTWSFRALILCVCFVC